jgi:hypothetical protein
MGCKRSWVQIPLPRQNKSKKANSNGMAFFVVLVRSGAVTISYYVNDDKMFVHP